jgi:hypothetical protein
MPAEAAARRRSSMRASGSLHLRGVRGEAIWAQGDERPTDKLPYRAFEGTYGRAAIAEV